MPIIVPSIRTRKGSRSNLEVKKENETGEHTAKMNDLVMILWEAQEGMRLCGAQELQRT